MKKLQKFINTIKNKSDIAFLKLCKKIADSKEEEDFDLPNGYFGKLKEGLETALKEQTYSQYNFKTTVSDQGKKYYVEFMGEFNESNEKDRQQVITDLQALVKKIAAFSQFGKHKDENINKLLADPKIEECRKIINSISGSIDNFNMKLFVMPGYKKGLEEIEKKQEELLKKLNNIKIGPNFQYNFQNPPKERQSTASSSSYQSIEYQMLDLIENKEKKNEAEILKKIKELTGSFNNRIDWNFKSPNEYSLLHCAAKNGFSEICEFLITSGAKKDITNRKDNTPLHLAYITGHTETAAVLQRLGADISIKNKEGKTPIDLFPSSPGLGK